MGQFFCQSLVWAPLAIILWSMLLIRFLQTPLVLSLIPPSLTPKLMCTSRRNLINAEPLPRVLPQILNRALTGGCANHFQILTLFCWDHLRPSWGCAWCHYPGTRCDLDPQNATAAGDLSWRILMCNSPSILLSILHIWPTLWGVAQPLQIGNPPPKLTAPPPSWSLSQIPYQGGPEQGDLVIWDYNE